MRVEIIALILRLAKDELFMVRQAHHERKNMKLKLYLILVVFILTASTACAERGGSQKDAQKKDLLRQAAVAGQFYPSNAEELTGVIDGFLKEARPLQAKGMVQGLIVPHAGYPFSGRVAAYGFKELQGEDVDTVILVGNSHHARFKGASVMQDGFFETPLGRVEVDSELARAIAAENRNFMYQPVADAKEHSLEVEVPFLQRVIKDFKIVPILLGNDDDGEVKALADAILKHIKGKNVVLIASSDLSHYPSYNDAKFSDGKIIAAILTGSIADLDTAAAEIEKFGIKNEATAACGMDSIKVVMEVMKGLGSNETKLLNAANSGDVSNDISRVVGYASIGFFGERRGELLNKAEQKRLLQIAKTSVEGIVKNNKVPQLKEPSKMLNENLGAFVTLRENGELRGCIGRFTPTDIPLYQVVIGMAAAAATEDMRFAPVTREELGRIKYEVSVLSQLKPIADWQKIRLGKDGVRLVKDGRGGVFLPQVATETGWNMDEFLGQLCSQKAGLPRECYKDPSTKLFTFTAQVFGE